MGTSSSRMFAKRATLDPGDCAEQDRQNRSQVVASAFAPVIDPTLATGVQTITAAALAELGRS